MLNNGKNKERYDFVNKSILKSLLPSSMNKEDETTRQLKTYTFKDGWYKRYMKYFTIYIHWFIIVYICHKGSMSIIRK